MVVIYVIGVIITFIVVSIIMRNKGNIKEDETFVSFLTAVIVSLLFPLFWAACIIMYLSDVWRKWVSKT